MFSDNLLYLRNLKGLSQEQVAEAVGMSDSNYFIKIFKKETGYTPLKYKKTLKDCT